MDAPGYLFEGNTYNDRERLMLLNTYLRERYDGMLAQAEAHYGLGADGRVRLLDVGCGEAIYVFALAYAERYPHYEAWGLDKDREAIMTVNMLAEVEHFESFLHFATHDVTKPFADVPGLFGDDGNERFDLVMEALLLMHLRDHKRVLAEMTAALRPGGTIFLVDVPSALGAYTYPHPSFAVLWSAVDTLIKMSADGVDVAGQHETLLQEAGYSDIISQPYTEPLGGTTPTGKALLEVAVLSIENARPAIVDRLHLIPAADFDMHVHRLRTEATPEMVGQSSSRYTIARKPL